MTPGIKTSEFWLTLVTVIVSEAVASGLVPTEGVWPKVTGLVIGVLAAFGYTHNRSKLKKTE